MHADVAPPDAALQIKDALECGRVGGNFRLRYPECGALGRWLEALAPFYRRLGRYYGDSGIFVRRDVYERVGGFPDILMMEDIVFVRRMEGAGKTAYRETIRKARALGLRVHEEEPHYDVDTPKTWSTSKKSSKKAPIRPHTRRSS